MAEKANYFDQNATTHFAHLLEQSIDCFSSMRNNFRNTSPEGLHGVHPIMQLQHFKKACHARTGKANLQPCSRC